MKVDNFFWNVGTGVLQACSTGSLLYMCARYGHIFKILPLPALPSDTSIALCGVGITALELTVEQLFKRHVNDFVSKFLATTLSSALVLAILQAKKIISLTAKDAVLIMTIALISRFIFSTLCTMIEKLYSEKLSTRESSVKQGSQNPHVGAKIQQFNQGTQANKETQANKGTQVDKGTQGLTSVSTTTATIPSSSEPKNCFGPAKWIAFQNDDSQLSERAKQSIYQDISTRFDKQKFNSIEDKMISQLVYIIEFLEKDPLNPEEKKENPFTKIVMYTKRKIDEFNQSKFPTMRKEAVVCDLIKYSKPVDADALIQGLSKANAFDSKMIKICIQAILEKERPDHCTLMTLLKRWQDMCFSSQSCDKSTEISVNDKFVQDAYLALYERDKNIDGAKNKLAIWLINRDDLQLATFKTFMIPFVQATASASDLEWEVENVLFERIKKKPEWQQELKKATDDDSIKLVQRLKHRKIIQ